MYLYDAGYKFGYIHNRNIMKHEKLYSQEEFSDIVTTAYCKAYYRYIKEQEEIHKDDSDFKKFVTNCDKYDDIWINQIHNTFIKVLIEEYGFEEHIENIVARFRPFVDTSFGGSADNHDNEYNIALSEKKIIFDKELDRLNKINSL